MSKIFIVFQVFYAVEGSEGEPIRAFSTEEKAKAYINKLTGEDPSQIEYMQCYDDSTDDSIGYYSVCIFEGEDE